MQREMHERDHDGRLARIQDLDDLKVAEGEPDPRRWDVIASDGRRIGSVDDLVVDTGAMKVRFLDCAIDERELGIREEDRHVLVPIAFARFDLDAKNVLLDTVASTEVEGLPVYRGLPMSRDTEQQIESVFAGTASAGAGHVTGSATRTGTSRPERGPSTARSRRLGRGRERPRDEPLAGRERERPGEEPPEPPDRGRL